MKRVSWRKRKELTLPRVEFKGAKYYLVSPSQLLTLELEGQPVCVRSKVAERPQVVLRRPLPFIGGEHEHVVIFSIEGGITVMFPGVAFLYRGQSVEVFGTVTDKKQIRATAIVTDEAEYTVQM